MRIRERLGWLVFASAALGSIASAQEQTPEPFDVLIRGGTIVDGTGNPWFKGDVAIRGDRIEAVGPLATETTAHRVIDARVSSSRPASSICTRTRT